MNADKQDLREIDRNHREHENTEISDPGRHKKRLKEEGSRIRADEQGFKGFIPFSVV
jgi:hypothetical protein